MKSKHNTAHSPLISVIIPVYNLENYLHEAIDSVLCQTYQNFELIVVDDGSIDTSRDIILQYAKQVPQKFRYVFQENQGAAAARNKGIKLAQGEWIAFLDGDDVWKPYKLERQLKFAEDHPTTNILSSLAEVYGKNGLLWNSRPTLSDLKVELLLRGCFITLSTMLIKKTLLLREMFDERLEAAHDIELCVRLAGTCRYFFVNESLIYYRIRKNSISDLFSTRYIQVYNHYQLVKREFEKMTMTDSAKYSPYLPEFRRVMRNLSHDAAYSSLFSPKASLFIRLTLSAIAIKEYPQNLKNYRFLLQSLLPFRINDYLRKRHHVEHIFR